MKTTLTLLASCLLLFSCKPKNDPTKSIEEIFEFDIPDCYTELENPEQKFDYNPHTIIELRFEEECMWDMYENQMIYPLSDCRKYYVGTTICTEPAWHHVDKTAMMCLDLDSRVLHFEDFD